MFQDMRWRHSHHVERLPKIGPFHGNRSIVMFPVELGIRWDGDHPDINGHIVPQVLIPCYEGDAILILKADTARSAIIDTIEILDRSHNRISGIMRVYLYTHGYACPNFGVFI